MNLEVALESKKITRKAFILKTSKVACGYVLLPVLVSSLVKCSKILPSEDCESSELYSECPCHYARFNIEGEVIKQPTIGSASPLKKYISEFSDQTLTIIDPDNQSDSFVIDVNTFPEIDLIGGYIDLESNEIDGSGFLVYRKSQSQFTVLSRECTHQGCTIGAFESPQ